MDNTSSGDYKRKVPVGIRAEQGHVPYTVFNHHNQNSNFKSSPRKTDADIFLEEHRIQKLEQSQLLNEQKKKDLIMLNNYNPWGKPGGGAPRSKGVQMNSLDKSLNLSTDKMGSFLDSLSKPGCGAPYRTESGNPIGTVRVHPDIRNNLEHMNEETKKKSLLYGGAGLHPNQPRHSGTDGIPMFGKPQILEGKQKSDEGMKNKLKTRLDEQIEEKRVSLKHERNEMDTANTSDWMTSKKVGYVQRDSSGKITRSEPLGQRGPDGLREFYSQSTDKGIVEQFGKPGAGVPERTQSGNTYPRVRGLPSDCDDPFRIGRCSANQVFPVDIEHVASERAYKRRSDPGISAPSDKHIIQNGYYTKELSDQREKFEKDARFNPKQPIGTVYSAVMRSRDNYLDDLRKQIAENNNIKEKAKQQSLDDDFHHINHSDIFGRPGNGAPRLIGGQIKASRNKLNELATHCDGIENPGAFRGLY